MVGNVEDVDYYGGATVLRTSGRWGAITLGSYIIGDRTIRAKVGNQLFMHEYGHYLQSQRNGPLYLTKYGIPSLVNATFGENHKTYWVEKDANRRAYKYFSTKDGFTGWNDFRFPRGSKIRNGLWWEYPLFPIAFLWNF
jgi:hypothetical protein